MCLRLFVVVFTLLILIINVNRGDNNVVGALSSKETELCNEIPRSDIEKYLSTKTPYRVVANLNDKPKTYKGCQPLRIWSVIRHGTRNPSRKVIEHIKTRLNSLRDRILTNKDVELCSKHLKKLSEWNFNATAEEQKYLVAEGEDELIELAERMQKRFPTLLPDVYNPNQYFFKYTATQRTLKSAQSFATGLFGRHRIGNIVYPEALHKDPVLRVFLFKNIFTTGQDEPLFCVHKSKTEEQFIHFLRYMQQLWLHNPFNKQQQQ